AAAPENVRGPNDYGKPDGCGNIPRLLPRDRRSAGRLVDFEVCQKLRKPLAVFRKVDRIRRSTQNVHTCALERERKLQRRLSPELDQTADLAASAPVRFDGGPHVLECARRGVKVER